MRPVRLVIGALCMMLATIAIEYDVYDECSERYGYNACADYCAYCEHYESCECFEYSVSRGPWARAVRVVKSMRLGLGVRWLAGVRAVLVDYDYSHSHDHDVCN